MTKARECGGKHGHKTRAEAEAHRWSLIRTKGAHPSQTVVYKCSHCGMWHVGHPKRRRRNQI